MQDTPSHSEEGRIVARGLAAALVSAPHVYLGMLVAVAVHEFVGHGLVSLFVGGQFRGVMLDFSGMGWADITTPPTGPFRQAIVLLGGPASTTILGFLLFGTAWPIRRHPHVALPVTILAGHHALEGTSYAFWNAVYISVFNPQPGADIGDIGRAVEHFPSVHLPVMVLAGVLMVLSIWILTAMLLWIVESYLYAGRRLHGATLLAWAGGVAIMPAGGWFLFDWNLLLPGMGHWPNGVAVVLHAVMGALLIFKRFRPEPVRCARGAMIASAAAGFGLMALMAALVGLWLRYGVTW